MMGYLHKLASLLALAVLPGCMIALEFNELEQVTSAGGTTAGVRAWWTMSPTTNTVGGVNGINADPSRGADSVQFLVFNSKLYATWNENSGSGNQIRMAVYNGNDGGPAWSFVDGNGPNGINKSTAQSAQAPQLVVFNSKLYASWDEYNGSFVNQIRMAVYNGNDGAPAWSFIDGNGANGINKNTARSASTPQLTVFNSKLYATWSESNGSTDQIRMVVYNGNDGAPAWSFVDGNGANGVNKNTSRTAAAPQLSIFNSKLYATWSESNGSTHQIRMAVYNGNDGVPAWSFVDGNGANGINKNTAREAYQAQLTEFNSKLYATWQEYNGSTNQIRMAVYNGNDGAPAWSFVDGNGANGINKNTARNAWYPQLTVFNSKLYATWQEWNASSIGQIRMLVYNGNDGAPAWSFVDGNGVNGMNKDTARQGWGPQLTVFDSKLYTALREDNGSGVPQIRMALYNGNDGAASWGFVDSGAANSINKDPARQASIPQLLNFNSKLYAAWYEYNGSSVTQIRMAVYNGNNGSPAWSFVDGNGANGINKNTARHATAPKLLNFNSKLYATWYEENGSFVGQIRIAVYNGNDSSPVWSFVDGNGANGINKDPARQANGPQLLSFNSKLYATWFEINGTAYQIRMAVYNGNDSSPAWSFVDGNGANGINKDPSRYAGNPQLLSFNSKLYATWSEYNGSSVAQIRMAVYNGNDSSPFWSFVDGNGANGINKNSAQYAFNPELLSLNSKLYATWFEENGSLVRQIRMAVYNGNDSSPVWSFVDGNGVNGINIDVAKSAGTPSFAIHNDELYVSWSEGNATRIARYGGDDAAPTFDYVGSDATSYGLNWSPRATSPGTPRLQSFGGSLFMTKNESGKIVVLRYGTP
jgi:hypothetical protein